MAAFTRAFHIPLTIAETGGAMGVVVPDTGAPTVILSPMVFPSVYSYANATLTVASQSVPNVPILSSSEQCPDPAFVLGGLVGGPVLFNHVVSFDYRDGIVAFGNTRAAGGLSPDIAMPFALEGQESTIGDDPTPLPPSRVVVVANIEGATYRMLLDTGASAVTVDQATFAALTADGRVTRAWTPSSGSSYEYARVHTMSVSAASAQDVVIFHDTSADETIAEISFEMGDTIHGLIGGTFLERFEVTLDYPNKELHLAPYEDTSFLVDNFHSVGMDIGERVKGGYRIANVPHETDAEAKGVLAGDAIVAIDGQAVDPLSLSQVEVLLSGPVGSTTSVEFGV
ncbi:MAG: aspartyl protease family protein, partial [Polyangiaceae bacterium]